MADATVTDIGKRTYYLEVVKALVGAPWFGWLVAAVVTLVTLGPSYAPSVVTQYLPGAKPVAAAGPTLGDLHALLVNAGANSKFCADKIEKIENALPPAKAVKK